MYIHVYIYMYIHIIFIGKRRLPRGGFVCTRDGPTPQFGSFWIIFDGWSPNLTFNKAIPHGFEQICSNMTQKLEEKVQSHDEDAECSKTGCRSPSREHGKAYEQAPAQICGSYARRSFARSSHLGGRILLPIPPNIWGRNLNLLTEISSSPKISSPPIHNIGLRHQVRKPPIPNPSCPYEYIYMYIHIFISIYIYIYICI